jgi:hypothetical protein
MSEKPTKIQVNRYYRPYTFPNTILSDRGVTVMYTLDYGNRMFIAQWSICNGDNFSKVTGIQYAQACSCPISGPITPGMKLIEMLGARVAAMLNDGEVKNERDHRNLTLLLTELVESI